MTTGPDVPAILCYAPDACCGASPCAVDEDEFVCQVRSLLPEGEPWNNTRPSAATPAVNEGAITVGCARVGCEQLVLGGCCADNIPCEDVPVAPQLAVVDAFSAVGHGAVIALCRALRELDPCTADQTIRHWADRFGIGRPDPCGPPFPDAVLAVLVCLFVRLRREVINLAFLRELAAAFGADLVVRDAGDMNCGPLGWWTMARTRPACPETALCPPAPPDNVPFVRMVACSPTLPPSLNFVLSPADINLPPNCNLPPNPATRPHDPDLYQAFKWLLPQILPQSILACVYERDPANCIV